MVLLTDGPNSDSCEPVQPSPAQARGLGTWLIPICIGEGCDQPCLRGIASNAIDFRTSPASGGLAPILVAIADRILEPSLASLGLVLELPESTTHVSDSALPRPEAVSEDGTRIAWAQPFPAVSGSRMTLAIRPSKLGFQPALLRAEANARDRAGLESSVIAPRPYVDVFGFVPQ